MGVIISSTEDGVGSSCEITSWAQLGSRPTAEYQRRQKPMAKNTRKKSRGRLAELAAAAFDPFSWILRCAQTFAVCSLTPWPQFPADINATMTGPQAVSTMLPTA